MDLLGATARRMEQANYLSLTHGIDPRSQLWNYSHQNDVNPQWNEGLLRRMKKETGVEFSVQC